jgi:hypothetical protein
MTDKEKRKVVNIANDIGDDLHTLIWCMTEKKGTNSVDNYKDLLASIRSINAGLDELVLVANAIDNRIE